ncbi:type II toxin-antitoxin system Phd/YefM family antitoxin [Dictyobacter arantiisoli]|uniref:Antitoxin n=1 Tax=Dictyobacter arantiisoli TaxID=2014874 RepID=A0A5A5T870_9CHLR|nr:type II toxin-antitoxin system Phd/YefM family antitoxin [Dictyobacter arantiisoli]GCF07465.1 hypothetical protein KDI_10290 [Dictyobacter arantiisoli]
MAERHLSLSEAQEQFTALPQLFQQEQDPIIVTQNDQHVMAILPIHQYAHMRETIETLSQTLEILSNEKFMASFRLAQRGMKTDILTSLEQIKQELGWEDEEHDQP